MEEEDNLEMIENYFYDPPSFELKKLIETQGEQLDRIEKMLNELNSKLTNNPSSSPLPGLPFIPLFNHNWTIMRDRNMKIRQQTPSKFVPDSSKINV